MKSHSKHSPLLLSALLFLLICVFGKSAGAEEAGWFKNENSICYYVQTESGNLVKAAGLVKIGGRRFYFSPEGELQTGWVKMSDGIRYFKPDGNLGARGRMFTGFQKVGSAFYYFNKQTGLVTTGLVKLSKHTWFFSRTGGPGKIGRAVKKRWVKIDGSYYYFGANGAMKTNGWVKKTYYVGADGKRLTNTITPDGYLVDENGSRVAAVKKNGFIEIGGKTYYYNKNKKKFLTSRFKTVDGKKYYLDEDGVRVSGWLTLGSKRYYFDSEGVMKTGLICVSGKYYYMDEDGCMIFGKTVNGYVISADGEVTKRTDGEPVAVKKNILIFAGHGQGDSGAVSPLGQEYQKTREFAKLVYEQLKKDGSVNVEYWKDGSTAYDMYQQNKATLGALGITSKITGTGSVRTQMLAGMKRNSNLPDITKYDYALEVHFNASGTASKDYSGNGVCKGFSFYVNMYKKDYTVERKMISRVSALGFKIFANGVHPSSGLLNARIFQEAGVPYSLVETAFIDDADDMSFYNKNKDKMAKAVALSIVEAYGG